MTPIKTNEFPFYLRATSEVETGNKDDRIGSKGERSRYQISYSVWIRYTKAPFDLCGKDDTLTYQVAFKHTRYLQEFFFVETVGKAPTAFDLAVMWNAGENYYKKRQFNRMRLPKAIRDYANRVENIYAHLSKMQKP